VTLDDCGDVVTLDQVVAIFQYRNHQAIYRAVKRHAFPTPDLTMPARWSRERLRLWWTEGRQTRKLRASA